MPTLEEVLSNLKARDELQERDVRSILEYTDQESAAAAAGVDTSHEDARTNLLIGSAQTIDPSGSTNRNIVIGPNAILDPGASADDNVIIGEAARAINNPDGSISIGNNPLVDNTNNAVALHGTVSDCNEGIAIGNGTSVDHDQGLHIGDTLKTYTVSTTDATPTLLASFQMLDGTIAYDIEVVGFEAATGDTFVEHIRGAMTRQSGVASILGADDVVRQENAGATTWTVTTGFAVTTFQLEVTGQAAHNIEWRATLKVTGQTNPLW